MSVLHCTALISQPLHSRLLPEKLSICCERLSYSTFKAEFFKLSAPQQEGRSTQRRRTRSEATMSWQEVATEPNQRPTLPRSGHAAAPLPAGHSHDVFMFGGYTEDGPSNREACNEAWLFSASKGEWAPVKYAGTAAPRARLVSQAAVVGNSLYIIGGWDPGHKRDGGDILNDIWKLDLESYAWEELHPQGLALQPISRHQACAVGDKIWIHTHRNVDDVLVLDTSVSPPELLSLPISSTEGSPTSRGLHSMTVTGNSAYIYGGAPKEGGMLGDLWELNLDKRAWRELDADGKVPHVRCSHAAAAVGDDIYFFGGSHYKEGGGLQPLNDLFVFDTKERRWRWPQAHVGPSPRNAGSLTALADGRLVAHGGWDPFKETYDDTFLLETASLKGEQEAKQGPGW